MRAVVIHQDDLLQQVGRRVADDATDGSLDDGQGLIQVDQHHTNAGQDLRVSLRCTPVFQPNPSTIGVGRRTIQLYFQITMYDVI